jgi:prepilin-type N-terminal cleavage/methylation domain-containing protein
MATSSRKAFTLVELLVVISIIGMLVGLLLPAVQAAREAARRMQCTNNLHQIALAAHNFHDTFNAFPPGRIQPRPGDIAENSCGGSQPTWLVRILPFLEQTNMASQWDYSMPYADHPTQVRTATIANYCCPSRRSLSEAIGKGLLLTSTTTIIRLPCGCSYPVLGTSPVEVEGSVGDYGGNHGDLSPGAVGLPTDFNNGGNGTGVIISSRGKCTSGKPTDWLDRIGMKSILDGTSNTLLAGEMHVPMGKLRVAPEDAFIFNGDSFYNFSRIGGPTLPIVGNPRAEGNALISFGSWHNGICNFAFSDGSVRALSSTTDTELLGNLCNRADGRVSTIDE